MYLVVITGKERPTQQEFNKLAEVLNITDQAVSGLHEINQDLTLTLLPSPAIHLIARRRTVLERTDVTGEDEHCIGLRNGTYPIFT